MVMPCSNYRNKTLNFQGLFSCVKSYLYGKQPVWLTYGDWYLKIFCFSFRDGLLRIGQSYFIKYIVGTFTGEKYFLFKTYSRRKKRKKTLNYIVKVGITMPPFHCYCCSATIPYIEGVTDGANDTRAALEPVKREMEFVEGDVNYEEWYNNYIKNTNPRALTELKTSAGIAVAKLSKVSREGRIYKILI